MKKPSKVERMNKMRKNKILKELSDSRKTSQSLNSYTKNVYKSDFSDIDATNEDVKAAEEKSKYEKLRHLTNKVLGVGGFGDLSYLSRDTKTMFLENILKYKELLKILVDDIKNEAGDFQDKGSINNFLVSILMEKYFFEDAILTENLFHNNKPKFPPIYSQDFATSSGLDIKQSMIKKMAENMEKDLITYLDADKIEIDPFCDERIGDWFISNFDIDLKAVYLMSKEIFSVFGTDYRFSLFLGNSIRNNYLGLTKIGKVIKYLNEILERCKLPLIELNPDNESITKDYLCDMSVFDLGYMGGRAYDLEKLYHETNGFDNTFDSNEAFEIFLNRTIKENCSDDEIKSKISTMIYEHLGMSEVHIDYLCEENTYDWIKKNLFVDIKKLRALEGIKTDTEMDKLLNKPVKAYFEDMFNEKYGDSLESWFNKLYEGTFEKIKKILSIFLI